jgi:hypothetical protein
MGTLSPYPWDFPLLRRNVGLWCEKTRAPWYSGRRVDAPVASLRCRIPRSGVPNVSDFAVASSSSAVRVSRALFCMYYGSEFINYTVARLLGKLLIEQTKSRAHHTGDNGLVECKNGAIIRKHIGFGYIDAQHAQAVDQFHRQHLNPYVNFHRPCAVPKIITEANGKRRRVYLRWATPWELLQEAPHGESLLRPGVTLAELAEIARVQSDTEAALAMQRAKRQLLIRVGKHGA